MSGEQTIPVVNLKNYTEGTEEEKKAFINKFGEGLQSFGFVAVEGHGVPQELIDANYELFEDFFDLDEETKRQYEQPESGRQRGYTPFGIEQAKDGEKPDLKEFWHVGQEFDEDSELADKMPQNLWPDELPGFKQKATDLFDALESSGLEMLKAISEYLGEAPNTIADKAVDGNSIIRIIHYPVCEGFKEPGAMRAAEHEDINLITLLPAATDSGLEILTEDGEWMPVPMKKGQLIVDTGDMMKRLTNNTMPATTHRVVNPEGEPEPRYSRPFFRDPHRDARLDVLDNCVPEGEEPNYEPITADEFLKQRLEEIGVADSDE
jgi:isopenicillin N synthase-like dioxygenase